MEQTQDSKVVSVDTRYEAYVSIYTNLDTLIWANLAALLTITTVAFTAIGLLATGGPALGTVPVSKAQAAILLLSGVVTIVITYVVWRMRVHHEALEAELRKLEPLAYFARRLESTRDEWMLSATLWVRVTFVVLACCEFVVAVLLLRG